ncbi:DNA-binding protein [Aquitalea sp. USM4]|uniref:DNA-binding protein n=1 Tax=Aquitalea sp. USM4 TaxID=1590041 RepID=UPI0013F16522|nr:DNA-binding protein [Aquitalea sp. USM4]
MAADIYSRIRQVALELVGEGVWPTVVEVRARLGTGSNTTINNTLKEWRQDFLSRMASSSRHPDWPSGLAEAFGMIWQKSCEAAEQQWEAVREEAEAEVASARQAQQSMQVQLEGVESSLQSALREIALRTEHQQALELKLQTLTQQYAQLESRCQGLEQQLVQERAAVQQARQDSDARQAETEARHELRLQEARQEAERRESLAYERLEGLRLRLYEQVEEERVTMKQTTALLNEEMQTLRQQAAQAEQQWRERLADREREAGKQQARLEMLEQRNLELQDATERQQAINEQGNARLLAMAGENARLAAELSAGVARQVTRLAQAMQEAGAGLLELDEAGKESWLSQQLSPC